MSRDPKTAEATRAQVVSAALQSLARAARRAASRRAKRSSSSAKDSGLRSRAPSSTPRTAMASRSTRSIRIPRPRMTNRCCDRSPNKPAARPASTTPIWRRRSRRRVADLDHYFVLSFPPLGTSRRQISSGAGAREAAGRAGAIAFGLLGARCEARRSRGKSRGAEECAARSGRRARARTSARGSACLAGPTG